MKVMVDTNVVLDVWLVREPYWQESAQLIACIEQKKLKGILCPTTVTTLHYLGKKVLGEKQARLLLKNLLDIFEIGVLSRNVFTQALESSIADFEDAVIEAVSVASKVDMIASRDLKDFKKSKIVVMQPAQILERYFHKSAD